MKHAEAARPTSADLFGDPDDVDDELDDLSAVDVDADESAVVDEPAPVDDDTDDDTIGDAPAEESDELVVPGLVTGDPEPDDDTDEVASAAPAADDDFDDDDDDDMLVKVRPRGPNEFCCQSCFLVLPLTLQTESGFCRDCD